MRDHPVLELLDKGLMVTVNSDDPAYFGGYLTANYAAIIEALAPSQNQVIDLIKNGFAASFLDESVKARWIQEIDASLAP